MAVIRTVRPSEQSKDKPRPEVPCRLTRTSSGAEAPESGRDKRPQLRPSDVALAQGAGDGFASDSASLRDSSAALGLRAAGWSAVDHAPALARSPSGAASLGRGAGAVAVCDAARHTFSASAAPGEDASVELSATSPGPSTVSQPRAPERVCTNARSRGCAPRKPTATSRITTSSPRPAWPTWWLCRPWPDCSDLLHSNLCLPPAAQLPGRRRRPAAGFARGGPARWSQPQAHRPWPASAT